MIPMRRPKPLLRNTLLAFLLCVGGPAGYAGYLYLTGNVHEVVPGTLYRSGQLDADELDALIRRRGIRSVLNLRGAHKSAGWWRQEALTAASDGVQYYNVGISAGHVPHTATMMRIVHVMEHAPKPLLVHCEGGSDRAGLASALFELVDEGETPAEAAGQLSFAYGHFPWLGSRSGAMDQAFAEFAAAWVRSGDGASAPTAASMPARR